MSTTLTNGLKLPDKGSVDWYADMQSNYAILDGAVGTVAEHTSQIAGKAPAVHTHTKADITDFPAYGTTAGTICEGNDSRLSDARTPVAHTHTKSDVTDLLNSNFIPSANNSYNLGSSSYQWNNLYAKNYYYNGTAWGLDKANEWTGNNKFISPNTNFGFKSTTAEAGSLTASSNWIYWQDKNNFQDAYIARDIWNDGSDSLRIAIVGKRSNGAPSTTGREVGCGFRLNIHANGNTSINPFDNGGTDLGTSSNKWKTLNGINPGALSLPGTGGFTDIKGDITNLSGGDNTFTAPYDGWVCIKSNNATVIHIINTPWAVSQSATQSTAGTLCCLCPVMSGQPFSVVVNATSLEYAYIHPCKGNV